MKTFAFLALAITASAADMFPFQLPWDDATPSITNVSWLNDKPAGRDGFVSVKDGHLFAGEKRLRIFGVNMCFSANFPKHEDAEKVAARMAKFGINCVRFHHMDMFSAPSGIFAKDGRTLDAEQLDRLDYFISELKKNGIYADLNLHVSRTYPDRTKDEKKGNPQFDKGVDNFHAPMIALQRDYARDLLTHVNKYTSNAYFAEPAVALVEINNENALGFQWFAGELDNLPQPYREDLEAQWGAWILKKHGTDEAARKSWAEGARTGGEELLATAATTPKSAPDGNVSLLTKGAFFATDNALITTGSKFAEVIETLSISTDALAKTNSASAETISSFAYTLGTCAETVTEKAETAKPSATSGEGKSPWFFETHSQASAKGTTQNGKVSLIVEREGAETWNVQFSRSIGSLKEDSYEVKFRVKAPKMMQVSVLLQQAQPPWKVLSSANVKAGPEWREVSVNLKPSAPDEKARLTISGMGRTVGTFEFSDFSMRTATIDGALVRDDKGRVPMLKKGNLSRSTTAKQRDWQEFIWDTETVYWNGMRDFLRKELGVKVPIVGTQGFWSPGHVQAGMDVIDSHAYWHHPNFEGGDWNLEKWTIKNEPMAGAKDGGTLPGLAAQRVAGKPFICTEYNHSAPNTYGAETAPLLAAFAALQDWDGVFLFAYSHGDKWQQEHFDSFFDIARHPVKMATLPGAAVLFRRDDFLYLPGYEIFYVNNADIWQRALRNGPSLGLGDMARSKEAFQKKFDVRLSKRDPGLWDLPGTFRGRLGLGGAKMEYVWESARQQMTVDSPGSKLAVGSFDGIQRIALSTDSRDEVLRISPSKGWACFQLLTMQQDRVFPHFTDAKRILITATGDIANTDMGWKNAEKTTVGRDWGRAPVLVEGPAATIELPGGGAFKAWALDERGQRREELPVAAGKLTIGPQFKTLWYEVERQ